MNVQSDRAWRFKSSQDGDVLNMMYGIGLFAIGVALVSATGIPSLWHRSPERWTMTWLRVLSFVLGLACLTGAIHVLA